MMIRENNESDMRGSPPSRWSGGRLVLDLVLALSVWPAVVFSVVSNILLGRPRHAGMVSSFTNIIIMGKGIIRLEIFCFGHNSIHAYNNLDRSPLLHSLWPSDHSSYKCFLPPSSLYSHLPLSAHAHSSLHSLVLPSTYYVVTTASILQDSAIHKLICHRPGQTLHWLS